MQKTGHEQLRWTKSDPDLDALRDDPRIQDMILAAEKRLGASSAWISRAGISTRR